MKTMKAKCKKVNNTFIEQIFGSENQQMKTIMNILKEFPRHIIHFF